MASNSAHRSTLEGWAKEDARYVISLATEGQLGMTLNARNLELMVRRCAAHPLAEAREYGDKLYATTQTIAPSLVRYTEATQYDRLTRDALVEKSQELIQKIDKKDYKNIMSETDDTVTLLDVTPDADDKIIASLIHSSSHLPMNACRAIVSQMNRTDKEDIIRSACRYMKSYDPPLREFENADLCFEVTISATCFAQLKRHRMATIISQDYDPNLGITIPPTIYEIGMENRFMEMISRSEDTYGRIKNISPLAADYILTNAHRKRVSIKVNARELYHISRLREDEHAQWDIRDTAQKMVRLGKQIMPLTLMLATGKDNFDSLYDSFYTGKT
jgi:thymidylate synthase ThyX